jgi:hypothetical protein
MPPLDVHNFYNDKTFFTFIPYLSLGSTVLHRCKYITTMTARRSRRRARSKCGSRNIQIGFIVSSGTRMYDLLNLYNSGGCREPVCYIRIGSLRRAIFKILFQRNQQLKHIYPHNHFQSDFNNDPNVLSNPLSSTPYFSLLIALVIIALLFITLLLITLPV